MTRLWHRPTAREREREEASATHFAYRLNNNVSRPPLAPAGARAGARLIRRLVSWRLKAASEQKRMPSERASVPSSATARYPPRLCDRRIDILRSLTVSPVQIDTEYDYPESNEGVTFGRPDYQPSPCCSHSLTSRRCSFSPYIILSVFIPPLQFWQRTAGQFHPSVRPPTVRKLRPIIIFSHFRASAEKCGRRRQPSERGRPRPFPFPLCYPAWFARRRRCGFRLNSGPDWVHCNSAAAATPLVQDCRCRSEQMWDIERVREREEKNTY